MTLTINSLRRFNRLQEDVISSLEAYERSVAGGDTGPELSGYTNGYALELDYLRRRRMKLDEVIASMERYREEAVAVPSLG